ncbi:tight junction protein ZO-3-like isoform X1 [Hypanus sabinus]|uniref:tight junction protein ZO-3-like isoform X1 n=2 Tax=Hypanus sabinus TaxID=79690 RepID=UPI0028C43739|nr:tight junction protein ZO-3-like isoform X1 [Hypanus sabinus]
MAVRFQDQFPEMEETLIWEQHTVMLYRDPKIGFGIAISGGRDKPNSSTGETAILVSDVIPSGPAEGKILIKDRIVMVNGVSMENVLSSYAIQCLKSSGKAANITVKRPRKVQIPVTNSAPPGGSFYSNHSNQSDYAHDDASDEDEDYDPADRNLRRSQNQNLYHEDYRHSDPDQYSDRDHSYNRSPSPSRSYDRSPSPSRNYNHQHNNHNHDDRVYRREGSPAWSHHDETHQPAIKKPIKSFLIKNSNNEEYGLRLGSQIFIKHMTSSGLASKEGVLQEGDVILKINGIVTENISLEDTKSLIERSEGKLRLVVLRDNEQFLVNIPELEDSEENSSGLEDISDLEPERSDSPPIIGPDPANKMKTNESLRPSKNPVTEMGFSPVPTIPHYVIEDATYAVPVKAANRRPPDEYNVGYSPAMKVVRFVKDANVGLQLAGGNDVGIFVSRVLEDSPAAKQGIQTGDQILKVNDVSFQNLTREEAVLLMLDIPKGQQVEIRAQRKEDIFKKMINSNVGDSFYVRTHFEHEVEGPQELSFRRGDVFRVIDTMYKGKLGAWYAVRIGRDLTEQQRGTIPNKNRAEQIAKVEMQKASSSTSAGARAEFWKMRGLRGAKKNIRKSRDDLSALTIQGKFPPYERVVLREASYKRPVVILGPISDIATQSLVSELPDQFELAQTMPRNSEEGSSSIIKLETVRLISQKNKHGLLDITPSAIERLNYVKWYPIVVFFNPDNKQEVKAMRQHLFPQSRKSSKSLYAQAVKLRKYWSHLFTGTINLNSGSSAWFETLKSTIKDQQTQPVWFPEEKTEETVTEDIELMNRSHSVSMDYLSCEDSRANSDYEDTDAEGGAYTDNELDDGLDAPAITRSSEPVRTVASQLPTMETQVKPQGQYRDPYYTRPSKQDLNAIKYRRDPVYSSDEEDDDDEWNGPATEL